MTSEAAKRAVRDLFFAVDDDERAGVIQRVINDQTAPLRRAKKISDDAHAGLLKNVGELRALLAEVVNGPHYSVDDYGLECNYCAARLERSPHASDCLITRIRAKLEAKP